MANIAFPSISKTTKLSTGTTYSYVHVEPKDNKPYLLFLHGWPETSHDWKRQIDYFSKLGYGLVVPDLLGYGGTDKPKEVEAYKLKKVAGEVVGILDVLGIKEVIGIGHDWGCIFLSRFVNYHPSRFTKFAFLDIAYNPPSGPFSIDAINEATEKGLGYPIFGYWHFFNEEDAGKIMDDHIDSMRSLKWTSDPMFMKDNMCPIGACRTYFTSGKTGPLADWISPEEMDMTEKILAVGGYTPTLMWYKQQIANLNVPDEESITEERKHIQQPTLLVTCSKDAIAVPKMQEDGTRPFAKNLTIKEIDSGHFVMWEKSDELNMTLEDFFTA